VPEASIREEKTTDEYLVEVDQWSAHNYHPLSIVLSRGEGVWVWDVEGKRYLDCLSAYSALNQGHCHPRTQRSNGSVLEGAV